MLAVMETLEWPSSIVKPQFLSDPNGNMRSFGQQFRFNREKVAFNFESSLFADDCGILFTSCADLEAGTQFLYDHFASFELHMHVSRDGKPSKTDILSFYR